MRSSRFIAILVALMFAAIVPLTAAQASTDASAKARPVHVVKGLKADEIRQTGRFYVRGAAVTYKRKYVKLQKANCKRCTYKAYKRDRTTSTGRFRINFDGPRGSCYRIVVPGTPKYRTFVQVVGCIVAG